MGQKDRAEMWIELRPIKLGVLGQIILVENSEPVSFEALGRQGSGFRKAG